MLSYSGTRYLGPNLQIQLCCRFYNVYDNYVNLFTAQTRFRESVLALCSARFCLTHSILFASFGGSATELGLRFYLVIYFSAFLKLLCEIELVVVIYIGV